MPLPPLSLTKLSLPTEKAELETNKTNPQHYKKSNDKQILNLEMASKAIASLGCERAESKGPVWDIAINRIAARRRQTVAPPSAAAAASAQRACLKPPQLPPPHHHLRRHRHHRLLHRRRLQLN